MNLLLRWLGIEDGTRVLRLTDAEWAVAHPLAPWLLWSIVALGLAAAFVNFLPRIAMRRSVRVMTCVLRLAMLGLVLLALLGIEWHLRLEVAEPRQWLMLVDDSASMAVTDVGDGSRFAAATADLAAIRQAVDGDADVALRVASFSGAPLGEAPGQGTTDFEAVLNRHALSRHDLDRLILLTDGRDSDARDLRVLGESLQANGIAVTARVYGDTNRPKDRGIFAEPDRSVIRLGEPLLIRGSILAPEPAAFAVTLKEDGKAVATHEIAPEAMRNFVVRHQPTTKGAHTYTLELPAGDSLGENDRVSFRVDVQAEKIKVLLLEGYPRFEYKLFRAVLEVDPLIDLVSVCHLPGGGVYVQGNALHANPQQGLIESQAELFKYDVVILRDLPRQLYRAGGDTSESRLRHLVEFVLKRGGGLIVTGGQDAYRAGGYDQSHLAAILPFDLGDGISKESQFKGLFYVDVPAAAYAHPVLQLLPNAADNRERLNSLRQLDGANNVGQLKPLATPLLNRTVTVSHPDGSSEERQAPILAYMAVGEGKVIASAVDTMWRWQLQPDFEDPPLTMLLANMVRYVAPPPARAPGAPSLDLQGELPQVGRDLVLTTELRDKNYDPIVNAELTVIVTRPDESTLRLLPRDLPDEPGVYTYRVPLPQPGPYTVTATYGDQTETRQFLAGAAAGELANLAADPAAMRRLALDDGAVVPSIPGWLTAADPAPTATPAVRELEVWNSVPVLLLFILLVSLDCFIRKRQGLV